MRYPERTKEYRKDPRKNLKKYYSNTILVAPKPKDTIIQTYHEGYFKTTIYKNKTRCLKTMGKKQLSAYKKEFNVDLSAKSINYLGKKAFFGFAKLRGIHLPAGMVFLSERVFENCDHLQNVRLPDSIREIGPYAFLECHGLKQITLPGRLKIIRRGLFKRCINLKKVIIPESVKLIEPHAFSECRKLESVYLPNLTCIQKYAFYKCKNLKSIDLPNQLTQIGEKSFYDCGLDKIVFPQSLTEIHESAFLRCRDLITITLPPNLKVIEKWAFHGCVRLKDVYFTNDPEVLGEWIFNRGGTVVHCKKDSKVDRYCQKYGYTVEYIK
jgi:hypothetical protein